MDDPNVQSAMARFHQRELDELMRLMVHRELAIAAAMDYCDREGVTPPADLVKEAAALILKLLKREKAEKRGRAAGRIARYRQDQWDVERWDAVEEMRRIKKKVASDIKLRRAYGENESTSKSLQFRKRQMVWFKNGIFECASRYLVGRDARVGPDAMRASHRRCKRRAGKGYRPDKYHVFDDPFLLKLGIPGLHDRKPGTKFLFLYDLK
jgi:hypothetical protein